jgi:hypothetical protein
MVMIILKSPYTKYYIQIKLNNAIMAHSFITNNQVVMVLCLQY